MKIKAEACWAGRAIYFRLTTPCGKRFIVNCESWNRATAIEALNLLAIELPHVPRRSIRFDVH